VKGTTMTPEERKFKCLDHAKKILQLAESLKKNGTDLDETKLELSVTELSALATVIVGLGAENINLKFKLAENGINYAD